MAHWEPLAGHPAPHHLKEITMSALLTISRRSSLEDGAEAYSKCELFTPAQPEVSQNRPADVDAAQAAFEAALMAINTRTSTPYVAGTSAFNV